MKPLTATLLSDDELVLTFAFEPWLLRRSLTGWWRSAVPAPAFLTRAFRWAIGWGLLLVATLILGALGIAPVFVAAGLIGCAVLVLGFVVLQRTRMGAFVAEIGRHWDRAGPTEARLGPSGLLLTDRVSRCELGWAAIDAVVPVRGATVMRTGIGMISIPDSALPPGLSPSALRERIERWQEAGSVTSAKVATE
jgi:hypothetical protein